MNIEKNPLVVQVVKGDYCMLSMYNKVYNKPL